jgi:hypothetical protein
MAARKIQESNDFTQIFRRHEAQFQLDLRKCATRQLLPVFPFLPGPVLSHILFKIHCVLKDESSLRYLTGNVVIVGDLSGSLLDLFHIFQTHGSSAFRSYLFLGNLVNGSEFGLQVLVLIFISKLFWPEKIHILRGCAEFRNSCARGDFKRQFASLYGENGSLYEKVLAVFSVLPLGVVLNGHFLCVSGGIGPNLKTVQVIVDIR